MNIFRTDQLVVSLKKEWFQCVGYWWTPGKTKAKAFILTEAQFSLKSLNSWYCIDTFLLQKYSKKNEADFETTACCFESGSLLKCSLHPNVNQVNLIVLVNEFVHSHCWRKYSDISIPLSCWSSHLDFNDFIAVCFNQIRNIGQFIDFYVPSLYPPCIP